MLNLTPRRAGVALVVWLVLSGAACSSSRSDAHRTTTSTAPHPTSTTGAADTTTSTTFTTSTTGAATSSTTTTASGPPNCPTSQLTGSLGAGQGAAGHLIVPLVLTNHGTTPCQLDGYPGVSLLDASGATIGTPATRATRPVSAIVLAPGAGAQTELESQNPGLSPTPCWATSTSIKVFPPNQLDSLRVAGAFQVCGGEFTVTPIASA